MPWPFIRPVWTRTFRDDPDQNHPESTGVSPRARNTIDGVRISMALAYLDPARHRLNLTIKGKVMARRLLFDGRGRWGWKSRAAGSALPWKVSRSW